MDFSSSDWRQVQITTGCKTRNGYEGESGVYLLPTGSEERGVLGVGSIPVTILPSCQDMEAIAF